MQPETSNFWLVISVIFGAFLYFLNILVLILTLRVVKRYTEETGKIQLALTKQSEERALQTELPTKIYEAALRQIEQMTQQTGVSNQVYNATQRQIEELVHLRRLSVLPVFAARLQPDQSGISVHRLYLKNIGMGIAMNIEIARMDFISPPDDDHAPATETTATDINTSGVQRGKKGYSIFQPIQSLSPNSEQVVKSFNHPADPDWIGEVIRQQGYIGLDFLSLIDESTPLHIDFQDLEGNRYHQVITRKGDIFVSSPVKLVDETDKGKFIAEAHLVW